MQEVHTLSRLGVPLTMARTVWMFGFQRRRVRRCECETLLPKPGLLPHTSQTEATVRSIVRWKSLSGAAPRRDINAGTNLGSLGSIPDSPPLARTVAGPAFRHRNVGGCFYAAKCGHAARSASAGREEDQRGVREGLRHQDGRGPAPALPAPVLH